MKLFVAAAILLTLVGVTAGSRIGPFAPDAANAAAPLTQVTISGLKVADKNYDGNTSATIDWSGATLGGVTPGDSVSINHAGVTAAFADLNAGANKPATISGLSLSGADAGKYALDSSTMNVTATINKTVFTVNGLVVNNKTYDGTTSGSIDYSHAVVSANGYFDADIGVYANGIAAFSDKNVGNGKQVTITGFTVGGKTDAASLLVGNYIVNPVTLTADITPKALTIDGITATNKTYDGTTAATINVGAATLTGKVGSDDLRVDVSASTADFAGVDAGNGQIVVINGLAIGGTDKNNYALTSTSAYALANITPKALTLTGLAGIDKVYDGTAGAQVSYNNLAISGEIDPIAVDFTNQNVTFSDKNAGNGKLITVTGLKLAGLKAGNYTINTPSATANITPKPLSVTGITANDKTYDGDANATLDYSAANLTGKVGTDDVSLDTAAVTGAFANKDAGNGKSVAISGLALKGAASGNYTLSSTTAAATADIMPKTISVTGIAANDKIYDGETTAMLDFSAASLTGKVGTDDVSLDTAAVTGTFSDEDAAAGKSVAISGLALKGAAGGNYTLSSTTAAATADITPKQVSVTGITADDKTYDGDANATLDFSAASLTGKVGTDDVSLDTAAVTGTFSDQDADTGKSVAISGLALSGAASGNYTLASATATATADITPKQVSVTGIAADDKTYDGDANATLDFSAATLSGIVGTDDVALDTAAVTGAFADEDAGSDKSVAISGLALKGAASGNYTLASTTAASTADIAPKQVSVTGITADDKTYDGDANATLDFSAASLTGKVGTDDVSLDTAAVTGSFSDKGAATDKTVAISGLALKGAAGGNYTLSSTTAAATADITPKQVSVTGIAADDKTYDGDANATLDFSAASLTGKVGTDDVSLDTAAVTGIFSDQDAATVKSVAISGLALSGAASGNYTLASATATATANITPKPLAVTGITARNKTYDGKTTAKIDVGTAALTGIVGTDDVGLDASAAAGEFADRKTGRGKTVTVSGLALTGTDAGNYTLDPYTTTANINSVSVDPGPGQEVAPENHDLWTETTSQLDGNAVTTATVNQTELEALLAEGQARHITIDVQAESDDVRIVLNGQMIQMLNDNNATLEIRTGRSTYTLNAQQLNIDQAVKQLGQSISLQDVMVQIELASPSSEMLKVAEDAAVAGKFTVQVPPVEFAIHADYEGASVPVSSFSAYVKRTIALPDDVDPAKITTAVVIETNGTVHHVPTKIVQVDGKFYAQISSLTNSTYAVIWHPVAFSDMTAHWAKAAVNDMGSRMIIEGTGDGRFNPDGEITRAEFLAILVRGLGLKPIGGSSTFTDVKATDWFASAVNTAAAYQLVTGDKNGAFLPNDKITREQAMTILSKAMKLTGLQNKLSDAASDTVLHPYADAAAVSAWARSGVADSVLAGIVTGKSNGKLAPKEHLTRAETATVIQRLLQQSDLI